MMITMMVTMMMMRRRMRMMLPGRTGLIVEGGEADEHRNVDLPAAVDQQPEVLRRQVLQGVLGKHVQETLPHGLPEREGGHRDINTWLCVEPEAQARLILLMNGRAPGST